MAASYPIAAERLREFCRLRLLQLRARRTAAEDADKQTGGLLASQSMATGAAGRGGGALCQVSCAWNRWIGLDKWIDRLMVPWIDVKSPSDVQVNVRIAELRREIIPRLEATLLAPIADDRCPEREMS